MEKSEKEIAIALKDVSKTFYIPEKSINSIKDRVKSFFQKGQNNVHIIKALDQVTIDIYKGDFFGIVGHNGSGKSTLLRLILGAIKADNGSQISVNGRVLRLALGMGFDYNLSARHNIYVSGSIMGLTFKEIGRKFHEIVDFAGLDEFVDTPIKYYSSGMVSRLAFAISVYVNTDILLIDEFFGGVGDIEFREKSSKVFHERILQGKTVVFVSHELEVIREFCNRACILEKGVNLLCDETEKVLSVYQS